MWWGHAANQKPPRACGGHTEGVQRVVVGTCSQLKTSIVLSLVMHGGHVEGMWRVHTGCTEDAWRACGGHAEGTQRVVVGTCSQLKTS